MRISGWTLRRTAAGCLALGAVWAVPAAAQSTLDCDNPGNFAVRACVYPEGKLVLETSVVDWSRDTSGDLQSDSVTVGSSVLRIGLRRDLEVQIGITPFDHERSRDEGARETLTSNDVGGASLGAKLGLISGANSPVSVAIQPTITLPIGNFRVGSGGVGGEVVLPISYDVSSALTFVLTPEVSATGNRNSDGRHVAYGATLGMDVQVSRRLSGTLDYRLVRDRDPDFLRTEQLVGVSAAYTLSPRYQIDLGVAHGITAQSPRLELTAGFARHFS